MMRQILTLTLIAAALLAAPMAQAADLAETAKLLPENTFVFLSIDDTDEFCDKFEETRYYKLYKDPSMQTFFGGAKDMIRKMLAEEGDAFSRLVFEDKLCPTGKIAVAVVPEADFDFDEFDVNVIIMAQWADDFDQIRAAIEKDIQKQLDEGAHRKKDSFRGAEIVTVITEVKMPVTGEESDAEPESMEPEKDYYGFYQDIAFYSDDLETLQFTISQMAKSSQATLWGDADYQAGRKAVGPAYDMEFYLNLKPMIQAALAIPSDNPTLNAQKIMTTLGVDQLTGLSAALELTGSSKQCLQSKIFLRNAGPKTGIMKMLNLAQIPFKPPVFVSPESARISYINFDFQQAGDELGRMLAAFSPMAAVMMTSPVTAPDPDGSQGVVIKTDILDNLGSQMIFSEAIRDSDNAERPLESEPLFAIAVKDRQRITRALSKIHGQFIAATNPDTQREFLGHTIFTIPLDSMFGGMMGGTEPMAAEPMAEAEIKAGLTMPIFAFTVTDSHVIISTEDAVEQALRRISNPDTAGLGQKPWHQYLLSNVPSSAGLAGLDNMILYGRQFWDELKKGMGTGGLQFELENTEEGQFLSLLQTLPEFDAIKKYFGLSVQWGQSRDNGLYMEFKDLNWDQKDD